MRHVGLEMVEEKGDKTGTKSPSDEIKSIISRLQDKSSPFSLMFDCDGM